MLVGTGLDLVEVERIAHSIERYGDRFLYRIYTDYEIAYCRRRVRGSAESFAARFAAKEAGAKALGTGISHGVTWTEFQVERAPGGRPILKLEGRAAVLAQRLGVKAISLSLTHTATLAMASVVMEG
jgi:holo-[acyl-carrier protein] synthase